MPCDTSGPHGKLISRGFPVMSTGKETDCGASDSCSCSSSSNSSSSSRSSRSSSSGRSCNISSTRRSRRWRWCRWKWWPRRQRSRVCGARSLITSAMTENFALATRWGPLPDIPSPSPSAASAAAVAATTAAARAAPPSSPPLPPLIESLSATSEVHAGPTPVSPPLVVATSPTPVGSRHEAQPHLYPCAGPCVSTWSNALSTRPCQRSSCTRSQLGRRRRCCGCKGLNIPQIKWRRRDAESDAISEEAATWGRRQELTPVSCGLSPVLTANDEERRTDRVDVDDGYGGSPKPEPALYSSISTDLRSEVTSSTDNNAVGRRQVTYQLPQVAVTLAPLSESEVGVDGGTTGSSPAQYQREGIHTFHEYPEKGIREVAGRSSSVSSCSNPSSPPTEGSLGSDSLYGGSITSSLSPDVTESVHSNGSVSNMTSDTSSPPPGVCDRQMDAGPHPKEGVTPSEVMADSLPAVLDRLFSEVTPYPSDSRKYIEKVEGQLAMSWVDLMLGGHMASAAGRGFILCLDRKLVILSAWENGPVNLGHPQAIVRGQHVRDYVHVDDFPELRRQIQVQLRRAGVKTCLRASTAWRTVYVRMTYPFQAPGGHSDYRLVQWRTTVRPRRSQSAMGVQARDGAVQVVAVCTPVTLDSIKEIRPDKTTDGKKDLTDHDLRRPFALCGHRCADVKDPEPRDLMGRTGDEIPWNSWNTDVNGANHRQLMAQLDGQTSPWTVLAQLGPLVAWLLMSTNSSLASSWNQKFLTSRKRQTLLARKRQSKTSRTRHSIASQNFKCVTSRDSQSMGGRDCDVRKQDTKDKKRIKCPRLGSDSQSPLPSLSDLCILAEGHRTSCPDADEEQDENIIRDSTPISPTSDVIQTSTSPVVINSSPKSSDVTSVATSDVKHIVSTSAITDISPTSVQIPGVTYIPSNCDAIHSMHNSDLNYSTPNNNVTYTVLSNDVITSVQNGDLTYSTLNNDVAYRAQTSDSTYIIPNSNVAYSAPNSDVTYSIPYSDVTYVIPAPDFAYDNLKNDLSNTAQNNNVTYNNPNNDVTYNSSNSAITYNQPTPMVIYSTPNCDVTYSNLNSDFRYTVQSSDVTPRTTITDVTSSTQNSEVTNITTTDGVVSFNSNSEVLCNNPNSDITNSGNANTSAPQNPDPPTAHESQTGDCFRDFFVNLHSESNHIANAALDSNDTTHYKTSLNNITTSSVLADIAPSGCPCCTNILGMSRPQPDPIPLHANGSYPISQLSEGLTTFRMLASSTRNISALHSTADTLTNTDPFLSDSTTSDLNRSQDIYRRRVSDGDLELTPTTTSHVSRIPRPVPDRITHGSENIRTESPHFVHDLETISINSSPSCSESSETFDVDSPNSHITMENPPSPIQGPELTFSSTLDGLDSFLNLSPSIPTSLSGEMALAASDPPRDMPNSPDRESATVESCSDTDFSGKVSLLRSLLDKEVSAIQGPLTQWEWMLEQALLRKNDAKKRNPIPCPRACNSAGNNSNRKRASRFGARKSTELPLPSTPRRNINSPFYRNSWSTRKPTRELPLPLFARSSAPSSTNILTVSQSSACFESRTNLSDVNGTAHHESSSTGGAMPTPVESLCLPDDLLDLAVEYCGSLGADQAEALISELNDNSAWEDSLYSFIDTGVDNHITTATFSSSASFPHSLQTPSSASHCTLTRTLSLKDSHSHQGDHFRPGPSSLEIPDRHFGELDNNNNNITMASLSGPAPHSSSEYSQIIEGQAASSGVLTESAGHSLLQRASEVAERTPSSAPRERMSLLRAAVTTPDVDELIDRIPLTLVHRTHTAAFKNTHIPSSNRNPAISKGVGSPTHTILEPCREAHTDLGLHTSIKNTMNNLAESIVMRNKNSPAKILITSGIENDVPHNKTDVKTSGVMSSDIIVATGGIRSPQGPSTSSATAGNGLRPAQIPPTSSVVTLGGGQRSPHTLSISTPILIKDKGTASHSFSNTVLDARCSSTDDIINNGNSDGCSRIGAHSASPPHPNGRPVSRRVGPSAPGRMSSTEPVSVIIMRKENHNRSRRSKTVAIQTDNQPGEVYPEFERSPSEKILFPSLYCQPIAVPDSPAECEGSPPVSIAPVTPTPPSPRLSMSELEKHLRGYPEEANTTSSIAEESERSSCSKVPFLQRLLTGELSRDNYQRLDRQLREREKKESSVLNHEASPNNWTAT